ncbi:HAMP domain-containing protein [Brevibacillus borstelensis]|jgi:methyl-accepting chemotaxis protein|uniref:methyl-accepting chemotaxis protein n=1 Tax=Brevibacillus borstelensis TaxID=45462 RepID=UPI000468AF3B|nr:methyl-accepting chemotaxis protein [Brevibacillus borstelensis]MCM3593127.1 methyl-accepting chemotaxis protein [Brevibacillus borstelensis]NOU53546.1 HAMP domain-containing protein [Brevibacillus borstelensis]
MAVEKEKRSMSLRSRLLIICLLLLGIPSLLIGLVGYERSKVELDHAGMDRLKGNVQMVLGMIALLQKEVDAGHLKLEDAQNRLRDEILGPKGSDNKRPLVQKYTMGETGYAWAILPEGISIMNPANEGTDINDSVSADGVNLVQAFVEKGTNGGGFVTYQWRVATTDSIDTKIAYVEQDPHWGWIVGVGAYQSEFYKGANQVLYYILVILGISLVLGTLIIIFVAKRITGPIINIAEHARRVSQGDLTVDQVQVIRKDEIGQLAQDFNKMTSHLQEVIREVRGSTLSVASTAEQLSASAEQSTQAGEQVAVAIQEVAAGSQKQADQLDSASRVVDEMAGEVKRITDAAISVTHTSQQASERSLEGNKAIQTAINQMNSINHTVEELSEVVEGLGQRSTQIGNIIEVITGIAEQTNLLALNAAVEAARAGEHGRGFAVVADEVRKLAEQSSGSAQQIADLIAAIQAETAKAVTSMESATQEVREGIQLVHGAGESFGHIQGSVGEVAQQIDSVASSAEKLKAGMDGVMDVIRQIAHIANETASGSQNVSAATEEQLAAMEEIASSAEALSKMMEELNDLVQRFKV